MNFEAKTRNITLIRLSLARTFSFIVGFTICGCGPGLETGNLVYVNVTESERVAYVAIIPPPERNNLPHTVVVALPSASEDIQGIIEDANNIWGEIASSSAVGVVIPSSDTKRVFSPTRFAGFAFGAEIYVKTILDDFEARFLDGPPIWVLVDIGGNGRRLVNILRESSGAIFKAYLVPSFSIDEKAIDEAKGSQFKISVIVGDRALNRRESEIDSQKTSTLSIERSLLPPLYSVDDADLESVRKSYAAEVVGRIQAQQQ